jgi:hypothetical protein
MPVSACGQRVKALSTAARSSTGSKGLFISPTAFSLTARCFDDVVPIARHDARRELLFGGVALDQFRAGLCILTTGKYAALEGWLLPVLRRLADGDAAASDVWGRPVAVTSAIATRVKTSAFVKVTSLT